MPHTNRNHLLYSTVVVATLWVVAILVLQPSFVSIVSLWSRSDTYTHGFFVLPISLYLIWRIRSQWWSLPVRPAHMAIPFIGGCMSVWLLGKVASVEAVEHIAAISLLPLLVWAVMGTTFCRAILFPLCFLLFAAPVGDFLIEPMMEFTADFTVATVRSCGIPVYREGLFFSLPTGNWSVVKACSGIRYIIASLTLGALFAYLTYTKWWKRLLFVLFAAFVPVIANGLRAVMIVLIGHYSSMKLATGVDHLVYGWVFFGIVVFVMFWIGGWFADKEETREKTPKTASYDSKSQAAIIMALLVLTIVGGFRLWQEKAQGDVEALSRELVLPRAIGQWTLQESALIDWEPRYYNPSQSIHVSYARGDQSIGLYIAYFQSQSVESELASSINSLVNDKKRWRAVNQLRQHWGAYEFSEAVLRGDKQDWLTWSWFQTQQGNAAGRLKAKLYEVSGLLRGQGSAGAGIVIYHKHQEGDRGTAEILAEFLSDAEPILLQPPASELLRESPDHQ